MPAVFCRRRFAAAGRSDVRGGAGLASAARSFGGHDNGRPRAAGVCLVSNAHGDRRPPTQLCMRIDADGVRRMPAAPLPDGYLLRACRRADAHRWAQTLRAGGFTTWTEAMVLDYLADADRRAGSLVVERQGSVAAGTFASRVSNYPFDPLPISAADPHREGLLDYVVTHPNHRGRGLGRAVCAAVTKRLVDGGCRAVWLSTDDWRLPAIHVYLSLGYRPVMVSGDMPERWDMVMHALHDDGNART